MDTGSPLRLASRLREYYYFRGRHKNNLSVRSFPAAVKAQAPG